MSIKSLYTSAIQKRYFSLFTIIACLVFVSDYAYKKQMWVEPRSPIQWDVISYYEYLPATFIHHDWSLSFLDQHPELEGKFWHSKGPDNCRVVRTSLGMSILYSPFFLIGHTVAGVMGYPQDGFSDPYEIALLAGSILFCGVGLYFVRKTLMLFVGDLATSLTIVSLILGTNLFYYTAVDGPMSHAWLFSLYAMVFYFLIQWYIKNKTRDFLILAMLSGILVTSRPTEIIVLILPLLIGVKKLTDVKVRIMLLIFPIWRLAIAALLFVLPFLIQMLYWKQVTGSWLYYSYQEYGFFFDSPMILEGLFGFRKGWFVYTPLAAYFVIGFYFLYKKNPDLFWPLLIWFLVNLYITFSWCIWWYGGSFGMRALIQGMGVLALNMALFYEYVLKYIKVLFPVLIFSTYLIYLNYFQTNQFQGFMIHWDSMTREAYWYTFHKTHMTAEDWPAFEKLLEAPDYESRKKKMK